MQKPIALPASYTNTVVRLVPNLKLFDITGA
jgi:hypothetical protein